MSLSKVSLTKSSPTVSLTKGAGAGGQLRINLNWSQGGKAAGGFFKRAIAANAAVDLDLGCLWETVDGSKGVVQALGRSFGALDRTPYVLLDGDDRSGQATGGENLLVNLDHLDRIKRILVFAYIYEGVPNWAAADGVVTMYPVGAQPIEIVLDEPANDRRFCAIAMLTNSGGGLKIERQVRYISGSQRHVDEAYGWGMSWSGARK
ncbi:MAG TPA: hypothetical protein VN088_05040 [Nocardioides sp.]|nr:hypothetical protein [Nocardioides sp.]